MGKAHKDDHGKVKFRFIEFEFEGSNSSIQESLRNIASALKTGREQIIALPAPPGRIEQHAGETVEMPGDAVAQPDYTAPETNNHNSSSRSKPKRIRTPKVLELDLISGDIPLKKFCDSKGPTSDIRKYLVITAWLKAQRNIVTVTADHIHTCYRHMDWHTPKDPGLPLRDLKQKNNWLNKVSGPGEYAINHLGENEVSKMGAKSDT